MDIKPEVKQTWSAMRPAIETMVKSHLPLADVAEMFSRAYVDAALKVTDGNVTAASKILGVHRNTIYRYTEKT